MDVLTMLLLAGWLLDVLAVGIRVVWVLVTIVSVISLVVVVTHLVPRKEY